MPTAASPCSWNLPFSWDDGAMASYGGRFFLLGGLLNGLATEAVRVGLPQF